MADLVSLKKELKCWESMFARKHGRKPSKEDIDGSSDEIKDTYRQYASIKSKQKTPHKGDAGKQVQSPPVLDDSGWGNDLLKKSQHAKTKPSKIQTLQIHKHHRPTFKLKKLRKNEDEENSEKENGVECEEISSEKIGGDGIMTFEIDNKIANTVATKNVHRKSVTSLRRRQSLFKNCSNEWLNTCKENIDSNIKNSQKSNQQPQIYNISDDNMNNFDSQTTIKKYHVNDGASNKPAESCTELHHEPTEKQSNANKDYDIISKSLNHEGPVKDYDGGGRIVEQNYTKKVTMEELIGDKPHTGDKPENTGEKPQYNNSTGENPSCGRAKSSRAKVEENCDTEDEIVPKEKLVIRKIRKKKEETTNKNEDEIEVEEKDGKRKRKKNTESEDNVDPKVKKIKLNTTKSKKLVSQNFVKIDLRKKTYTRGTQGKLTGAQYKRRQWKQKTSFELPSKQGWQNIGKKVCFKCGGEGHWAKFCRGRPKKVDPFSKLNEERASIDFDNLDTENKSCFDYLGDHTNENQHNEFLNKEKVKFTIDDVLDIQPVWPRQLLEEDLHEGSVSPLYTPVDDQPSKEAYAATEEALQTFGFEEFREGQHDAAARIVSGLSTLVILSTGSGKSLCYQLPAYLYYKHNKSITLVVSPLVALMQDQVANLPSWLPGACLNSNMTKLQQKKVVRNLKAGEIAVLLISPEALVSGGFGSGLLPSKDSLPSIAFACVDEAHCLSEWSHNFRPSYLMVCKALRERYDIGCLLGLTATASQTTATSVTRHLGITGAVIRDPQPVPDNLFITASRDPYRDQALVEMLQTSPFSECASIIVYVTRRLDADRLAALLRANLPVCLPPKDEKEDTKKKSKKSGGRNKKPWWWTTECYHAGLSPAQRRRVQTGFMSGELRVVVATVAFGMGLDKRDVRAVIHYNMPSSFENYVQEIGRAGRDGEPAYVHVFLDDQGKDLCELRRHIYSSTIDRTTVNKLIDVVFPVCSCTSQQKEVDEEEEEDLQHMTAAEIDDLFSAECDIIDDDAIDGDVIESGVKDGDVINKSVKDGNVIGSCDVIEDKVVKNEDVGHSEKNENEIDFEAGENEDNNASSSHVESSASVDQMEVDSINRSHQSILRNEQSDVDQELSPCFGHRVAFGVDSTVQALDMPKVNISTILAYLELHPRRWLKVLNPLRDACTVKCYGGPEQFQLLGRRFAPIALALRQMPKSELRLLPEMRSVDLSFARIADLLCCEALTVAREVRGLQWNMTFALDAPLNTTGQSGIIVECEQLSFHVQTTQKVIDEDRDDICDFIHDTVDRQEETRLLQLDALYNVLRELSRDSFHVSKEQRVDAKARQCIGRYFLSDANAQTQLLKEMCVMETRPLDPSERRWNSIASDIGALVGAHPESRFSGRAVARIFHGIDSPCFPALAFGRDKRFWRQYLDVDFNLLRRFASEKLVHYRR